MCGRAAPFRANLFNPGAAPHQGHSPRIIVRCVTVGRSHHRTSDGIAGSDTQSLTVGYSPYAKFQAKRYPVTKGTADEEA
jgi:hypothetical protein